MLVIVLYTYLFLARSLVDCIDHNLSLGSMHWLYPSSIHSPLLMKFPLIWIWISNSRTFHSMTYILGWIPCLPLVSRPWCVWQSPMAPLVFLCLWNTIDYVWDKVVQSLEVLLLRLETWFHRPWNWLVVGRVVTPWITYCGNFIALVDNGW